MASLDSSGRTLLVRDGVMPKYANGHLIYLRDSTLHVQPFDAQRLTLAGEAVSLANDLMRGGQSGFSAGAVSVSETGVLAYLGGSAAPSELLWLDRTGTRLGSLGGPGDYSDVALAHDGAHAAVSVTDPVQDRDTSGSTTSPAVWATASRTIRHRIRIRSGHPMALS